MLQASELFLGLWLAAVCRHDLGPNPLAAVLLDESLQAEPHSLGAIADDAVGHQTIQFGGELVVESRNHLRHAFSIALRKAYCHLYVQGGGASVLLDAFALIALLADEPAAKDADAILRRGRAMVPAINLAEALDVLQRVEGISRERLDELVAPLLGESLSVLAIDEPLARAAADVRARRYHRARAPVSLADCVLVAATGPSDELVTADGPLIAVARQEGLRVTELTR